ncbi:ABC transporter ATP-binding protein [Enterococcus dongliensis]|uniref:ABC transporter ATP-binding protein n=1 Tax=Enterococcus dongliensis TaxID=2559925 RepID=A0AAW8TKF0_9ENTE|nr:ABC transporter ATP-binding protein [Enterococcus dongliensis]MDT2596186.1 ABC transporter ATP-binding protein [Enterococcus dongliensis]MDT2603907.1 ABC transporter ATP-binding protein [Enterococcus dongliensis]MDT2634197.1 ABC transporter ATP-binding protein [Enterococcus dongliensis]MDT2637127.1 ABC transporter ATP-binding protein [Enterococcus dongliensis]MDT2642460.1 ABC transporter ATP-binding protein [Enterococcus dongliensis]
MADKQQNRPRGGGHGHMGAAPVEKAKDFKGTIKKLISYLGAYKIAVFLVMIFAIASTIFNIWGPKILSKAITELFTGLTKKYEGTGDINFEKIGGVLLFMLGLYVLSSLFGVIQGWIMSTISQKITYRMRKEISEKINRMPMNYFESRTTGEVLSRITNDVDTLGQSLNQSLTQLITSTFTIVGVIVMMLSISVKMTGIAILIVPISLILIMVVVKNSQKYFQTQQEYLGVINGKVEETIGGYTIVRLFNEEENSLVEFKEQNDVLFKSAWKSQFLSGLMQPIMNFIGNLGYVGVAIAGGIMAYNGVITVGDIQAFIQYVRNLTQPIAQLAQVSNMLQSMAAAAERVFEFLNEEEEDQLAENPVQIDKAAGMVDFDHVQFGYTSDKIIIQDFTSHVDPGQTVAIVGPTGAGKTTMVKLLMRFYDVNSGAIKIDGHNIQDFNRADLRKNIGMVLQDTWLFKGTIMDNLRYGRLDATDEEVYAAAKAARVDHFIKTLPGGYEMELNEESSNISQGQKQLLTIARAILADKPILILDEATSSVDTRTEELIQEAMNNLMEGRTSFVIAHRLSTIKDADKILYMQDGDIKEQGTHEELLAQQGLYASLYNSQFEELAE